MNRNERIAQGFDKRMRLIEIGASYNPIIPKRAGWRTTVVDHASRGELLKKYGHECQSADIVDDANIIEEVDIIWREGNLADAFPCADHGTYAGIVASHVGEHIPDLVGFLRSADILLRRAGVFFLALPDKRFCFDFFRSLTSTGNLLDAMGRSRHSRGTLFDHSAYFTNCNGQGGWLAGTRGADFALPHSVEASRAFLNSDEAGDYQDCHAWRFTPASFELLILELNTLGFIPWRVARIEPQAGVEFFVWLERGEIAMNTVEARRLELLRQTVLETKEQVESIEPAPLPEPAPPPEPALPTISAVIPLYNGRDFVVQALESVVAQTLLPNEIIVVDDGSTDHGGELVEQFIREHPDAPIQLVRKENGGQSSARNFGIAHARGDLIALLDQDDAWYRHHLAELIKPFLQDNAGKPIGWVYSDLDEYDGDGRLVHDRLLKGYNFGGQHPKTHLYAMLSQDMFVLPSASLISRKAFDEVGGFDERLSGYEDDDLFLRLFRAGYGNVFLETPLSKWRIYPESTSYTYRMRRSRAVYFRKLLAAYPNNPKQSRYLTRDLVVPRFYRHAVSEFLTAVKENKDRDLIEETRNELLFVLKYVGGRRRKLMRYVLERLRTPEAVRRVYAIRFYLRPLARRIV